MSHILVVEDESIIRSALKRLLERNGYTVSEAGSVGEAMENHKLDQFDLIITDLRLPGAPGTDLISPAEGVPVLLMTSYASVKSAVESMRLGAVDYIAKPFDHDEMLETVERILTEARPAPAKVTPIRSAKSDTPNEPADEQSGFSGMIGNCPPMLELYRRINKVAPTDTTVLVLGQSGTGKELVAKALHEQSHRAEGPLISVNCAAIPETLIESELFGHEKGAFTGANVARKGLVEAADGGSLFLDEIGELPMEAQARLLRLLQEKEVRRVGSIQSKTVDVRLVAATHRNLKELAKEGRFREDLYYRLHVVELRLPPLKDRGEDIPELAQQLLVKTCERLGKPAFHFADEAMRSIRSYPWPGNVREMENAIERGVILCEEDGVITTDLLGIEVEGDMLEDDEEIREITQKTAESAQAAQPIDDMDDPQEDLSLEDYFQHFVLEHQEHMTETELAQKLGISRKCLWERRQRLGIPRKKTATR